MWADNVAEPFYNAVARVDGTNPYHLLILKTLPVPPPTPPFHNLISKIHAKKFTCRRTFSFFAESPTETELNVARKPFKRVAKRANLNEFDVVPRQRDKKQVNLKRVLAQRRLRLRPLLNRALAPKAPVNVAGNDKARRLPLQFDKKVRNAQRRLV